MLHDATFSALPFSPAYVGSLVWMAIVTGVMVVKTYPGGERLRPVLGGALFRLALLWFAHPAWLLALNGG